MHIKRLIKKFGMVLSDIWRKIYIIFAVPFILIWGALNIWNLRDFLNPTEYSKYFIDHRMLLLLPVGICVVMLSIISPCLYGCGRELLYTNRNNIFLEYISETILYSMVMTVEFVIFYRPILELKLEGYLKYLACIFMFSGVVLFLGYRIHKLSICIMVLCLLYMFEVIADFGVWGLLSIFSWNYEDASYFVELAFMIVTGFFCWKDADKQNRLYWQYDD